MARQWLAMQARASAGCRTVRTRRGSSVGGIAAWPGGDAVRPVPDRAGVLAGSGGAGRQPGTDLAALREESAGPVRELGGERPPPLRPVG